MGNSILRTALLGGLVAGAALAALPAARSERLDEKIMLDARYRDAVGDAKPKTKRVFWEPSNTALIIVDMWDHHWCKGAERRTGEVAPRIDRLADALRQQGVLIIHAPSGCTKPYEGTPARERAKNAPEASGFPEGMAKWCTAISAESAGKYPIDQSDGGCDDNPKCKEGSPWTSEIAAIHIHDKDAVSDSGKEIWNLLQQRKIKNVLLCGVHLNMCVLGRPFGLRNMVTAGKNTMLIRDLTDTMYNSQAAPKVNHFRGTDLMIEHVEKYVCATVTSNQLLGGKQFRFAEDKGR